MSEDYREAKLDPRDRAMLDFAAKLTRSPDAITADDLDDLRGVGFDDVAIHDIVQVASLFNYFNRLANGLGVRPESAASGA